MLELSCHRASRPCMGSRLEIHLYHPDHTAGRTALEAAFSEAIRLEALLSFFDPGSELSRINRLAAHGPVRADPELLSLIERSLALSRLTAGAFDITTAPLMALWGHRSPQRQMSPPPPEEVERIRRSVGYKKIVVDPARSTVEYRDFGLQIDFGAIGKGYAIDRIVDVLRQHDITSAMINFGSTVYGLGHPPAEDGQSSWRSGRDGQERAGWRIAIRDPRDRERAVGTIVLSNRALSTSGSYEQQVCVDGTTYGHIIDSRSGYPAAGTRSASVVAPTAVESDAFSTAAYVMGPTAARSWIAHQEHTEGLILADGHRGNLTRSSTAGWEFCSPSFLPRSSLSRRQFLTMAMATVAWMTLPAIPSYAVTYLTPKEALERLMPNAETFEHEKITLTAEQKQAAEALLNGRIRKATYSFFVGSAAGEAIGYGVILNVVGKEQPITFMVTVSPQWSVQGIEVLIYRESQGSEVRSRRFMKQFTGKTLAAPLKLGRDVHAISGATLSSRSTTYAAKKALALIQTVYGRRAIDTP